MSEENDQNKQKMRKTSAVPLRKETVRVTLKSTPAGAKQAPTPSAPKPPMPTTMTPETQPQDSAGPTAHNPDVPDVTSAVPLKQETMRVTLKADSSESEAPAPVAPTPSGAPKVAAPAPTVPLNVGASAGSPIPLATQPLGSASQPLPKATVQLQQTQQLSPTSPLGAPDQQAPSIQTADDDDAAVSSESNLPLIFAVAAFLLSLFLLFAQFQRASIWVEEHKEGSYGAIFSAGD